MRRFKVRTLILTIKNAVTAGVSACTGHQPFRVNQAIKEQLDKWLTCNGLANIPKVLL
jgi:hypothetical protein